VRLYFEGVACFGQEAAPDGELRLQGQRAACTGEGEDRRSNSPEHDDDRGGGARGVQALPGLPEVERLYERNRWAREEHPVQRGRLENRSVRGRSEGEGDDRGLRLRDNHMGGQQRRDSGEPGAAEEAGETDFRV